MKKIRMFPQGEAAMAVVWLLFLLIPLVALFPYGQLWQQLSACLILIFAFFYRNALFESRYFRLWLLGEYALALGYALFLGYIYLFMFPAWQLGFSKIAMKTFWRFYFLLIGLVHTGLFLGPVEQPLLGNSPLPMTIIFSLFICLAPLAGREFYKQQEQRKQLYQANQRMEAVIKGEERDRIARELHDSLGQSLSVMTIKLELAQKLLAKDPLLTAAELKETEKLSRTTLTNVRAIVADMRKRTVAEELIEIDQALTAARIVLITENEQLAAQYGLMFQNELRFILREAVTNVIRHSRATFCTIRFLQEKNLFSVTIADNGLGISGKENQGIAGMKERAEKLNGQLIITDHNGTSITFRMPMEE